MSGDEINLYRMPAEIAVSPAAIEKMAGFAKLYARNDTVVAFSWITNSQVRYPGQREWKDIGSGLDIGTYKREDIPADRMWNVKGIEFAVIIPSDVLEKHNIKEIDVTDREGYLFELR